MVGGEESGVGLVAGEGGDFFWASLRRERLKLAKSLSGWAPRLWAAMDSKRRFCSDSGR